MLLRSLTILVAIISFAACGNKSSGGGGAAPEQKTEGTQVEETTPPATPETPSVAPDQNQIAGIVCVTQPSLFQKTMYTANFDVTTNRMSVTKEGTNEVDTYQMTLKNSLIKSNQRFQLINSLGSNAGYVLQYTKDAKQSLYFASKFLDKFLAAKFECQ